MPDVGEIGLACVLDYLDFRQQVNWRDHSPGLAGWLYDFAAAPGYQAVCHPKLGPEAVDQDHFLVKRV